MLGDHGIHGASDHSLPRRLALLDQPHHLSGLGMSPDLSLREHEIAVHDDLEDPARGFDQLNIGVGVRFLDLGRQTGGPRLVASDAAVFDGDLHGPSVSWDKSLDPAPNYTRNAANACRFPGRVRHSGGAHPPTSVTAVWIAENRRLANWVRILVTVAGVAFVASAIFALMDHPELRAGAFYLQLLILSTAAALSRRFGIALPGKGFASFIMGVTLIAFLLRGWPFAILVGAIGIPGGDVLLRRRTIKESLVTLGHVVLAVGMVGLGYDSLGGGLGSAAISPDNLLPLAIAILAPPVLANATFYAQLGLAGVLPRTDVKLTLRWEGVVNAAGAGFAMGWVAVATADIRPSAAAFIATALVAAAWLDRRRRDVDPELARRERNLAANLRRVEAASGLGAREAAAEVAGALRSILAEVPEARSPELDDFLGDCDARRYAPSGAELAPDDALCARARELALHIAGCAR